jgi:hypothetical protein
MNSLRPDDDRHEFGARETVELLSELDARLRRRGIAAAIFVVGGAAIAATGIRSGRLTQDIDALTHDPQVIEEARALAAERGLPSGWLNANANMWMPPLPGGVLDSPAEPGLRVTYADDGFLLATKLVAQRAKDADDLVALATRLGLGDATPAQLADHIRDYYTDTAALEFILDGNDVEEEISLLAQDASRMLHRAGINQDPTDTHGVDSHWAEARSPDEEAERLRRAIRHEQRQPPGDSRPALPPTDPPPISPPPTSRPPDPPEFCH